jgi:AcrR family transcriptional regulator
MQERDGAGPSNPPRRRRKEARPGELVEAGLAEFAVRGFAATRLDDVARRAGVAKGTIYRYFENKEALFIAAVRSRVTSVLADAGDAVDAYPGPTSDLLRGLIETLHLRLVDSDLRVLIRIVIAESGNFPGLAETYHAETVAKGRAVLERIVRRGIARGEFRAGPATDLPIVLMAPAMMAAIWKMTFESFDPVATRRFLDAHLDLVLNSIVIAPPRD